MLRVWAVVGVLGMFAGCGPIGEGDAGTTDAGHMDAADACPRRVGGIDGTCAIDGERICTGGPGAGCRCVGGCWSCTPDECWVRDTGSPGLDGGVPDDDVGNDDAAVFDAAEDTRPPSDAPIAPADTGTPAEMTYCIDIFVSNTCEMTVAPEEIDIPEGQTAYFCWRNTSEDYPIDVWLSYGGGFTDLEPGATWNEPPGHCIGPTPHDEYADISTACSEHRFLIHCL